MTPEERGAWFVMSHSRYNVPKEIDIDFDEFNNYEEVIKATLKKGQVYKYISWYEHSGNSLSLVDTPTPTDSWDAGIAGFIIGDSEEEINDAFNSYKMYVEGDVYDYCVQLGGETLDSLCCLYGYDYAVEQAKEFVDDYYKNVTAEVANGKLVQ